MVNLFESDEKLLNRKSSKGVQLKWKRGNKWYKADSMGYEGLVEYIVSHLLMKSTLDNDEYVLYETIDIKYKNTILLGCESNNFLPEGWQLITLERLFQNHFGNGLNKSIYSIEGYEKRIEFIVEQTIRITGLIDFGKYMSKLLTIDAFFLNEDRHTHNIAVLLDDKGLYHYCPIFDNGASLLADTTLDYPLSEDLDDLMCEVKPKTYAQNFDDQLNAVEKMYGQNLKFNFCRQDVLDLINKESLYSQEAKKGFWILLKDRCININIYFINKEFISLNVL